MFSPITLVPSLYTSSGLRVNSGETLEEFGSWNTIVLCTWTERGSSVQELQLHLTLHIARNVFDIHTTYLTSARLWSPTDMLSLYRHKFIIKYRYVQYNTSIVFMYISLHISCSVWLLASLFTHVRPFRVMAGGAVLETAKGLPSVRFHESQFNIHILQLILSVYLSYLK